jgi:HSP20 family molecular chaperone IbpA
MKDSRDRMWADALDMLARTERLHRSLFQLSGASARQPHWEPPVDIFETEDEVLVLAALPGVAEEQVEAMIDGGCLIIVGERTFPDAMKIAVIHRLELPQGRFERRVPLPPGRYGQITRKTQNGCLRISLLKAT